MVVGEAEPVVEREGVRVVRLDLEIRRRGALRESPLGERRHHQRGQSLTACGRRHFERREARPAPVDDQPPDRRRRAVRVVDRREPHRGAAGQHLQGVLCGLAGPVGLAGAVVQGQPVRVRLPGKRDAGKVRVGVGERCQCRGPDRGVPLVGPAALRQRRGQLFIGVRPPRGDHDHCRQPALVIPLADPLQRGVQGDAGLTERQDGVGAAGESPRSAQCPFPETLCLNSGPATGRDLLELPGGGRGPAPAGRLRRGRARSSPRGRGRATGGHDLGRHQRRLRDPDALTVAPCDAQHTFVPGCENPDRVRERRLPRPTPGQTPDGYPFAHVSTGDADLRVAAGQEFHRSNRPSCSSRARERRY